MGPAAYDVLHAVKGMKDAQPQDLFEDLGHEYVGPVGGATAPRWSRSSQAKRFNGGAGAARPHPQGFGYSAAERHVADRFHSRTLRPGDRRGEAEGRTWTTAVFADEIVAVGQRRPDVVAITAAMMHPVRLDRFQQRFPDRTFDVGIAEQHAATAAADSAMGGLHPVVAVYATFLNRAFDQVLMDVARCGCGVTFVLDRARVTGDDGASHNGMWDLSVFQVVPGLRLAAPRDATGSRAARRGGARRRRATVVRFPRPPPGDLPAVGRVGGADVLVRNGPKDVLVVGVGAMATTAVGVAERLVAQGIGVTVVDPRWVKPVDPAIVELAREHRLVVSIEDNGRVGGCGAVLLQTLNDAGVSTPFRLYGVPQEFLSHAKRDAILAPGSG
ncbi:MAG: transketolase C-terminal domain-containing protein [Nocardioides sp.]